MDPEIQTRFLGSRLETGFFSLSFDFTFEYINFRRSLAIQFCIGNPSTVYSKSGFFFHYAYYTFLAKILLIWCFKCLYELKFKNNGDRNPTPQRFMQSQFYCFSNRNKNNNMHATTICTDSLALEWVWFFYFYFFAWIKLLEKTVLLFHLFSYLWFFSPSYVLPFQFYFFFFLWIFIINTSYR